MAGSVQAKKRGTRAAFPSSATEPGLQGAGSDAPTNVAAYLLIRAAYELLAFDALAWWTAAPLPVERVAAADRDPGLRPASVAAAMDGGDCAAGVGAGADGRPPEGRALAAMEEELCRLDGLALAETLSPYKPGAVLRDAADAFVSLRDRAAAGGLRTENDKGTLIAILGLAALLPALRFNDGSLAGLHGIALGRSGVHAQPARKGAKGPIMRVAAPVPGERRPGGKRLASDSARAGRP